MENVVGLASRGLGEVLALLTTLGYDAEWDNVPAAAFGAPQKRERLFIVAYPHGESRDTPGRPSAKIFDEGKIERFARRRSSTYWTERPIEPGVRYVAHGVPDRLARLAAGGNAVVPDVAEFIGKLVMEDAEDALLRDCV